MKQILAKHKIIWADKLFLRAAVIGLIFFAVSMVVNYAATNFATKEASRSVTDIILSNLPTFDLDFIIIEGALLLVLFTIFVFAYEPKYIPFVLKSVAFFVLVRATAMVLTHLGPYPDQALPDPARFLQVIGIGYNADLFFSGHTGMPFLLALIFWKQKILRYIYLAASIIFAVAVLLTHNHYSIDVFAAYFITYAIFHIVLKIFTYDYQHLLHKNVLDVAEIP
ncbi:MAG: conserved rane protein of unknown function [Candidatus Magasanikbacteria bacterium]|nr:conserved rane protein of unknown function [Candidatus Magasanikbacteria bacterium]